MIPVVVGSSPIGHPRSPRPQGAPRKWNAPPITRDAPVSEAFATLIRACIEQVHFNRPGALAGRDPEYLHQVRVAIRRLRVALRAFRTLAKRRAAEEFDMRLSRTMRRLGPARDWDVLRASRRAFPARAKRLVERAHAEARAALASRAFLLLLDEVLAWSQRRPWRASAAPERPAAAFGRKAVRRLERDLAHAAEGADWSREGDRHRIRIRAKRLRYAAGFFDPAAQPVAELRALQEALGDLRDLQVRRRLLRQAGIPVPRDAARHRAALRRVERAWQDYEQARRAARG